MISKPTVFILGAGASTPYNFPAGIGLSTGICQNVSNGIFLQGIAQHANKEWEDDARQLANNLSGAKISIDTWLSFRTKHEKDIGKYLIAREIIQHEIQENFDDAFNKKEDWYADLWATLLPSGTKTLQGFCENAPVTFITFNYDRSLEQALITTVQNTFRDSIEVCGEALLKYFPIIHVHGQLGRLGWQTNLDRKSTRLNSSHRL